MANLLIKNSQANLKLLFKDALGVPLTDFNPTKDRFTVIDEAGHTYSINSVTWDSNGNGTLNINTPNTTGNQKLYIQLDGTPLITHPSPLELALTSPYQGRFNLTNALVAWDCNIIASGVLSALPDYSSHNNVAEKNDKTTYTSLFTNKTQYKIGANGTLITKGTYQAGNTDTVGDTYAHKGLEVLTPNVDALCRTSDSSLSVPLIKTIQFCLWRGRDCMSGYNAPIFYYGLIYDNKKTSVSISIEDYNLVLRKNSASGYTNIYTYDLTRGNVFTKANEIAVITLRFNTDLTLSLFLNKTLLTTIAWKIVSTTDNAAGPAFAFLEDRWYYYGYPISFGYITYNLFDVVGYSDIKSDVFIQANAAAWGF